jgi:hypothetical protein
VEFAGKAGTVERQLPFEHRIFTRNGCIKTGGNGAHHCLGMAWLHTAYLLHFLAK